MTIPKNITTIEDYLCYGCSKLNEITIPNMVTTIGSSAFQHCENLTNVVIPNNVKSIGSYSFASCYNLSDVIIGNNVEFIDAYAFMGCTSLTDFIIPNSVNTVGKGTFRGCAGLKTLTIGSNVKAENELDYSTFGYCSNLTNINVSDLNPYYSSIDGVLYNKEVTQLLVCPNAKTTVTIPSSVNSIHFKYYENAGAFTGCSKLTEIHVGNKTGYSLYRNTFEDVDTDNCILYVPTGCTSSYKNLMGWHVLKYIVEENVD